MRQSVQILFLILLAMSALQALPAAGREETSEEADLTLEDALSILNNSPWARQETVTRVVGGIGSGVYGEKEIFNRYYVRLLSAHPIRRAYARIEDILKSREGSPAEPESVSTDLKAFKPGVDEPDFDAFIVIAVSFRSTDPTFERDVNRIFETQTLDALRERATISTASFPRLEPIAYYPPRETAVGARIVFPKQVDNKPVLSSEEESFLFELNLAGHAPDLRVRFPASEEILEETEMNSNQSQAALDRISEFRIQTTPSESAIDLDSERLAKLVNTLPQQVGGIVHGSIYEYHRNDNLDARNFFDPVGEALPEFKRNQFGLTLGLELGPGLNLFGSFDGLRINQGSTLISHIPTPAMKQGDFSELLSGETPLLLADPDTGLPFENNQIPLDRLHPVSQHLLSVIPEPNRPDPSRNFVNNEPLIANRDTTTLRVDYDLNQANQLSGEYELEEFNGFEVNSLPYFGSFETGREQRISISFTRTFSDNFVATWRGGFGRDRRLIRAIEDRPPGLLDSLGIDGVGVSDPADEGYPLFELDGYAGFGDEDLPENAVFNHYSLSADFTLARLNHVIRFGGDFDLRQLNDSRSSAPERGEFGFSGIFSGDSFADFMLGRPDEATRAVGFSRQDLSSTWVQAYVSDQWRLRSNLTLRLGASYHYYGPYRSLRNNISVFRPLLFEPALEGRLQEEQPSKVPEADYNDFSPRISLSYRPFESNKLVLRGSFSVYYIPPRQWIYRDFTGRNYPYYFRESAQASIDGAGLDLSDPFRTTTATELTVRDISPGLRTAYNQMWELHLEHQVGDNWTLEALYNGRRAHHELRILPGNVPLPGPGEIQPRRPNPAFGKFFIISDGGTSDRQEVELSCERRFVDGFTLNARLELRRRFDDNYRGAPSNPRDLRSEWAPSSYFTNRRLTVNYIFDLPAGQGRRLDAGEVGNWIVGGWRISGIARLSSGSPFGVVLAGDQNNDGISNDRPDRIGSARLAGAGRSVDRWFDTEAFAEPEPFAFGDAGRNILLGPGYHNWDVSLIKETGFSNGQRLDLRFAFFNAFNHPNFHLPNRTFGTSLFGQISGARRAREIEISVKYSF